VTAAVPFYSATGRYRTVTDGSYRIEIRRQEPTAEVDVAASDHFCLMVAWGETSFHTCDPTPGGTACF